MRLPGIRPACPTPCAGPVITAYNRAMLNPDVSIMKTWPSGLRRPLLAMWSLFWLLMILVAEHDNWHNIYVLWWQPVLWEGSSALVCTGLLAVLLRCGLGQQYLSNSPLRWYWQHMQWLPLIAAVFTVLAYGIRHGVYAWFGLHYEHEPWLQVWLYEMLKLALFLSLWLGVLFGVHSFAAWREQQVQLHAIQQALIDARLQQLKTQLHPHFLFNTLNTISALIHTDPDQADALLSRLAGLLRVFLSTESVSSVPLREELHLLQLYADIMVARFAARVQLVWKIDEAALAVPVPILLLQPLLENAFKHAVEPSLTPVHIEVIAAFADGVLTMSVANEPVPDVTVAGNGIGLRNCRERLQVHYGERATLTATRQQQRFVVTITIAVTGPSP